MPQMQYDKAWEGEAPIASDKSLAKTQTPDTKGIWPRLIYFDEETKERLHQWIDNEIQDFNVERGPLLEDWIRWQTLYWAEPAKKEKNFPFKKAANIVIPLAAIAVETVHAKLMKALFSVEPFWSIRPRSKHWIPCAKPFERFLQSEVEAAEALRVYEFCNVSTLEFLKLGTCIGKSGYSRFTKKSLRELPGGYEEEVFYDVENGGTVGRVPLANFIMRLAELDPQKAPLVGEKHRVTWGQLKKYAQSGRMDADAIEEIKNRWVDINTSSEPNDAETGLRSKVDELAHTEPMWTETFEFYELWLSFDVDGDGWDEEIVVDYHKESRTFLSARYNWYDDLHRPYRIATYVPVEGVWSGIGLCKMSEQFQNEVTTIRRQRLDNATLANMAQLVLKRGMGYAEGEPLFPGKMWFVDDPSKDIKEFKLSEVYPSSYANEQSVTRDWEKRTGQNDVTAGASPEGTPPTATSDLTRLAEGGNRADLAMKNWKRFMSLIGVDLITNYQIFGDQDLHWLVLGEKGVYVEEVLKMPSILVRKGAIVDLSVTDSITNPDSERREWLQLFQVVTGYYDRVLNLATTILPALGPAGMMQILQLSQRALMTSDEAVRRLMETFNVTDTDRFSLVEEPESNGNGQPIGPTSQPNLLGPGGNNQINPGAGMGATA